MFTEEEHRLFHESAGRDDMVMHLVAWHSVSGVTISPWQTHIDDHTALGWTHQRDQASGDMEQVARELIEAAQKLETVAREFLAREEKGA